MDLRFRRAILFALRFLFILGLLGIFLAGWLLGYIEQVSFWFMGYVTVLVSYSVFLMFFLTIYGGFKVGTFRFGNLVFSCFLAIIFSNVLVYLELSLIAVSASVSSDGDVTGLLPILPMLLVTLGQLIWAWLCTFLMNKTYYTMRQAREVVAIYSDNNNDEITLMKMQSIHERFKIVGVVDATLPLDVILRAISPFESVLLGTIEYKKRQAILNACYRAGKRINLLPSPMDIVLNCSQQTQILDTPVLLCRNRELTPEQALLKRIVDILFAVLGLIISLPFTLIVAILIKLYDRGPIFYKQERLTIHGRKFDILKLRSMRIDAEKGLSSDQLLAGQKDPRITPIGRFIRALRIDEIPQLINILRGDMALVGPRPERPAYYELYQRTVPDFDLRLKVKAGLTGYAQVYGRYNTSPRDKLNMDLFYIENYSLTQDLLLILMTFKILFVKESSQGVDYELGKITNDLAIPVIAPQNPDKPPER